MTGTVRQINISKGGMPKLRVSSPVLVTESGVEGDRQRNRKVHGGPNKAVLLLPEESIELLASRGYPVTAGSLGENLTISGIRPSDLRAGQQFRIGEDTLIELTTLRQPCLNLDVYGPDIKSEIYDLACRRGDSSSPRWALGGFYAKILRSGPIREGDPIALVV